MLTYILVLDSIGSFVSCLVCVFSKDAGEQTGMQRKKRGQHSYHCLCSGMWSFIFAEYCPELLICEASFSNASLQLRAISTRWLGALAPCHHLDIDV